ncbi:MAG: PepSY-associated TM helix domain-containing protein [Pseudomonadota bacterium]
MIELSQARTQRLLAVHGWSGTVLGLFLYVVVLTGTIAVLAHEIGAWSAGGQTLDEPFSVPVDTLIREQVESSNEAWREEIGIFGSVSGNIRIWMHEHATNPESGNTEDYGRLVEINPVSGDVVNDVEGWSGEVFGNNPISALEDFIVELHVNLHLPHPWGLYATGILGFIMLLAAVTGLLIHRHLIREAFLAPRLKGALLTKRDRHVLAGTWSLVFAFVLAFTGAFFSFAISLALPVVAATGFDGDQEAVIETLLGVPVPEDTTAVELANLDEMAATVKGEAYSGVAGYSVSNWGRADARVVVNTYPAEGSMSGKQYSFEGATGHFLGEKALVGTAPSVGGAALALMGPLHFGSFAGLLSKFVWVALGIAMTYVTYTGMQLWVQRRSDEPLWRGFGHWLMIVGIGTPFALTLCAHTFFAALGGGGDAYAWTAWGFVGASAFALLLGVILQKRTVAAENLLIWGLAFLLATLPLTRLLSGGTGWPSAIQNGDLVIVGMDVLMLVSAFFVALWRSSILRKLVTQAGLPIVERSTAT